MSFAKPTAEAETGGIYIGGKYACPMRATLEELATHNLPPVLLLIPITTPPKAS
jgi:hypothetical protein